MSDPPQRPLDGLAGVQSVPAFDHELEDVLRADIVAGASRLCAARRYRGLSTEQLAESSGLCLARIGEIESGDPLSQEEITRLSQTLNIPPALLAGE